MNLLLSTGQWSTTFYIENLAILRTVTRIYVLWWTNINRKKEKFKCYGKSNKELYALIEKKFKKFVKNKKEENGEEITARPWI